jgi:serine/threonine protein kinase
MIQPGQHLGAYEVQEQIGRGGIATVHKAYHAATNRYVAVKILSLHLADDPTFNERFDREAKVVANLQHIHILPVFDYGHQEDTPYLVMPLITGGTLSDKIRHQRLPLEEVARLFRQMASALDYAHQEGLLHRDIKPSNVLMDSSNNALLADFGLTRMLGADQPSKLTQSSVIGTPAYMSPEQGQGQVLDTRSDLYSMGVMLYEMLTGDVPYQAETPIAVIFKHVTDPLPSVLAVRPDLPSAVEAVLHKAMAKNAADRYGNALEMAEAFEVAAGLKTGTVVKSQPVVLDDETAQTFIASTKDFATAHPASQTDLTQSLNSATVGRAPSPATAASRRGWLALVLGLALVFAVLAGLVLFLSNNDDAADPLADLTPTVESSPTTEPSPTLEPAPEYQVWSIAAHEDGVLDITFSPDGTRLLTGGADNLAALWNARTGDSIKKLEAHTADVLSVAYHPNGQLIVTGGADSMQYLWDAELGTIKITNFAGLPVVDVVYNASGTLGAYITDQQVTLSTQPDGTFLAVLTNPDPIAFTSMVFGIRERFLFTGDANGQLLVWNLQNNEVAQTFQVGSTAITALASMGGQRPLYAIGNQAGQVRVLNSFSQNEVIFPTQARTVYALVFSPDDLLLAAALEDGTIPIFNTDTQALIVTLTGHEGAVRGLAFSPDGTQLASAGMDGTVRLWTLPQ